MIPGGSRAPTPALPSTTLELTMRTRDAFGLTMAPLFLRIMLAAIFLFTGLNKVIRSMDVPPDQAAHLANIGVIEGPKATLPRPFTDPTVPPLPDPTAPVPVPDTDSAPTPTTPPTPPEGSAAPGGIPSLARVLTLAAQPDSTPSANTPSPDVSPTTASAATLPAAPERTYTAADFPEGAKIKPGLMIAMSVHAAAAPAPNADGTTPMRLLPERLSQKPWPLYLAWAATLTEIIAAALLVIGLFTRLSALGLAGVMAVAMWLTEIGPAIQAGTAQFGFLPNYGMMDPGWQHLMLQFSLFASAMALFFLGAGAASLDAAIFGGPGSASHTPPPRPRKPIIDD